MDEILPRALPITGESPPEDGPPTDGESYLRRVRWEARRCPLVVKSDIDPRKYDDKQTQFAELLPPCAPAPQGMTPTGEWEEKFLSEFVALRQTLTQMASFPKPQLSIKLPHHNDARGWLLLCFGSGDSKRKRSKAQHNPLERPLNKKERKKQRKNDNDTPCTATTTPTNDYSAEECNATYDSSAYNSNIPQFNAVSYSSPSNNPMYSVLEDNLAPIKVTSIGQYSLPPLLSIIVHLDQVTVMALVQHHISWLQTKPITAHRAQWLHSLLAMLEKPIDADVASALRDLLRRTSELRANLTSPTDPLLPPLNILITIVAKYFGQQEPDA